MPPTCLYEVLDVPRDCDEGELKKAYRRLAKKWHPDKNNACTQAIHRFVEVNGAYDILSDPIKRAVYDEYGDASGADEESMLGKLARFVDKSSMAETESDRAKGLLGIMFGVNVRCPRRKRPSGPGDGSCQSSSDCYQDKKRLRSADPIHKDLELTLEELYHGCRKRLRVGSSNDPRTASLLSIDVQPGWHEGTRITFAGKGDLQPQAGSGSDDLRTAGRPRDLVITIKQKPHPCFWRHGNDLVTTVEVPLATALCGGEVSVRTLSQKSYRIRVPVDSIIDGYVILPGEGMPDISSMNHGEAAGDHRVHFKIKLPVLSTSQRARMDACLRLHEGSLDSASPAILRRRHG